MDFHTWSLLKGVGLATMLSFGSELSIGGDGDFVEALRKSAQTNVSRAGDQIRSITARSSSLPCVLTHSFMIVEKAARNPGGTCLPC
ncbi:hypothetical protein HNO88_001473 [Novosphingobium chloroacetimidivorans]|uniref:Uncharacterized protein n=1 Tax=Novosphingobium chloroacetimidivorans TaxID=1428314 RepID=A0A7W7NW80_9SPHN|nr:hypothetical protein [Novosphingobium chloroacetimidivorans]MBB4858154.1 hypothetical protein [Novosphingobium chloroacetimidivorans]